MIYDLIYSGVFSNGLWLDSDPDIKIQECTKDLKRISQQVKKELK
jgi:hypothetical protein